MTSPVTQRALSVMTGSTSTTRQPDDSAKLRDAAKQLEALFVQQLFKVMRDTVPQQEGFVSGGSGEEIFTGLLDQHLAAETPRQLGSGLTEALYRQLRGYLPTSAKGSANPVSPDTVPHEN